MIYARSGLHAEWNMKRIDLKPGTDFLRNKSLSYQLSPPGSMISQPEILISKRERPLIAGMHAFIYAVISLTFCRGLGKINQTEKDSQFPSFLISDIIVIRFLRAIDKILEILEKNPSRILKGIFLLDTNEPQPDRFNS